MDNESEEEWRPIPGYEGAYEASNLGNIRSLDRVICCSNGRNRFFPGVLLKGTPDKDGYLKVSLYREKKLSSGAVHRLVMSSFVGPPPPGMEVCHSDGNNQNNRLSNLRYDTKSANAFDTIKHGRHSKAGKTECIRGHPLTPDNLYIINGKRFRKNCKECYKSRRASRAGQEE